MCARRTPRLLRSPQAVMTFKKMPLEEWLALPECPMHEADSERAKTEQKVKNNRHLRRLHPLHLGVFVAETRDGRQFRINGYSRAYVWEHSLSDKTPKTVDVNILHVRNVEEVNARYQTFYS
jgi:hypothetical protein